MNKIADYSSGRENNFDFIRFIAAGAVLFSHSFPLTTGHNDTEPLFMLTNCQTDFGVTAVNIFFIISGFLVTKSMMRKDSVREYFIARALRIFPALAVMIMLLVFVGSPILTNLPLHDYFSNSQAYQYLTMIFVFNSGDVHGLPGVFENNPFHHVVNGSLWTLRYELTCYLLLPAVVLLFRKRFLPSIVLFTAVSFIILYLFYAPLYLVISLLSCFLSGALLYIYRRRIPMHGLIALIAALLIIVSVPLRVLTITFPWLAGYLVIYLALVPKSALTAFGKYGDFSYGIYIWAFPVQQIFAQYYSTHGSYFNAMVSFPIVLLLSVMSWHFIEKPALKFKLRIGN